MSSNYTGDPGAIQPPGHLPTFGAKPIVNIPADGDPLAASSVAQAFKELADFGAFQNSVAQYFPPLAPATDAIGYTSVTHVGAGTGTCTPTIVSPGAPSTGNYAIVVKIIVGGAVATATFQWSSDGGETYGATQTTAATYTDSTTGYSVAFAGTFVADDTYAFSPADNPIIATVNALANVVQKFDHTGYFIDRSMDLRGNWAFVQLATSTANVVGDPSWDAVITSAGGTPEIFQSAYAPNVTDNFPALAIGAGTTAGDQVMVQTQNVLHARFPGLVAVMEGEMTMSTVGAASKSDYYWGLSNQTDLSSSRNNSLMWAKLDGHASWRIVKADGSTLTPAINPSSLVFDRLRIEVYYDLNVYGTPTVRWILNNKVVHVEQGASVTPNTTMHPIVGQISKSGIASQSAHIGPIRLVWNRYANNPEL